MLEEHLKQRGDEKIYRTYDDRRKSKLPNRNKTKEDKIRAFKSYAIKLLKSMGHPPYPDRKDGIVDLDIALATSGRPQVQLDAINSLYHMIENPEDYLLHGERHEKKSLSTIVSLGEELKKLPIPDKKNRIAKFINAIKTELYKD